MTTKQTAGRATGTVVEISRPVTKRYSHRVPAMSSSEFSLVRAVAMVPVFRVLGLLLVLGGPAASRAATATCTLPDTDLALVFDSSHSISDADFTLEKEGIAGALEDPSKTPQDGSVCVTVIEFHRRAAVRVPYRCIASPADAAVIAADVRAVTKPAGDPETGIDIALATATNELSVNARPTARQVIVLATDGLPNVTEASCNVRPVAECPPCASLDAVIVAAKDNGIDELHLVTVEDRENQAGPLVADDFERFYGCRAYSGEQSAGTVVTVRDFEEFTRVVADTVAGAGCGTRVDLSEVTALPGGTTELTATLASGVDRTVRAAGVELTADPQLTLTSCADCEISPGVEGALTCTASPNGLRATVQASSGVPLQDGALFACRFGIPQTATLGTTIDVENRPHAVSAAGTTLATVGRDGTIDVTSCPRAPIDCTDGSGSALRIVRARFAQASASTTAVRLRAALRGADLGTVDPSRAVVFLQVGNEDDGAGTCAEVPLAAFERRGRKLVFEGAIDSARGLDRIILRPGRRGAMRVRARGGALELTPPEPGVLRVRLGIREPDGQPDLCPSAAPSLRNARRKAVTFP
jgi:hypothetical protein